MLGTPSWTPQEANFVMSDRLRAIAGPEEVKGCRVAPADLTRVLPAPLRTCSAQAVKENPLIISMNKAFTGEPEPPVLDVDNLSVSTSVLQHDPFGGDPCTMPHSSTTTTTGPTPSSSATPSAWQTLASPSRNPSIAEPTEPGLRRRAQRSTAHSKIATVGGGNSGGEGTALVATDPASSLTAGIPSASST